MSRQQQRQAVLQEVTALGKGGQANLGKAVSIYERWCQANDEPAWPVTAERLLLLLHSHYPDWGWSWARQMVRYLRLRNAQLGHPDPTETCTEVRDYLATLRVDLGARKTRPVDAFAASDVAAVPGLIAEASDGRHVARLRATLVVAEALGVNPASSAGLRQLSGISASAFAIGQHDVRIRALGQAVVIAADRHPSRFECLVRGLNRPQAGPLPLARYAPGSGSKQERTALQGDLAFLTRAVGRALMPLEKRGTLTRARNAAAQQAWDKASPAQRELVMAYADPFLDRRLRDAALFLHGVATGHRHADLAQLRLGDLEKTRQGYCYRIARHKGSEVAAARGGVPKPIVTGIDHLADDPDRCPVVCPACAVARYIEHRRRVGAGDEALLYVASNGKGIGEQEGRRIVKRLWALLEQDRPDSQADQKRRIGSRSLRVTAATLARAAGMSYVDIARDITHHASLRNAELYVRRCDTWSCDVTLGLDQTTDQQGSGTGLAPE